MARHQAIHIRNTCTYLSHNIADDKCFLKVISTLGEGATRQAQGGGTPADALLLSARGDADRLPLPLRRPLPPSRCRQNEVTTRCERGGRAAQPEGAPPPAPPAVASHPLLQATVVVGDRAGPWQCGTRLGTMPPHPTGPPKHGWVCIGGRDERPYLC